MEEGSTHAKKMATNPNLTCPECGKTFPSEKSMYGHLRSHPERDYRGINRQAPAAKKNPKPRAKTRSDRATNSPNSNDDIDPEVVAALLLLSDPERLLDPPRSGFDDRNALDLDGSYHPESIRRKVDSSGNRIYRCDTCFKVFSSHQALGGHVASHNKNKIVATASRDPGEPEKGAAIPEHKCKICGLIFSSGQALGGHQRRHFKELCHHREASPLAQSSGGDEIACNQASPSSPETEEEEEPAKRRLLDFDLNMEPLLE
ncbi:zinc finger protein ZAT3-like [Curcuma longa]|uniref:zinc finger protein ZAT3-like n=1 Tax=Curcuma longa TaxID=136217 RepID=UPI003D9EE881